MNRNIRLSVLDPKSSKVCDLYDSGCQFAGQAQDLCIDYAEAELTELSFALPLFIDDLDGNRIDNPRWDYIKNEYKILYEEDDKKEIFNIKIPIEESKGNGVYKKVTCLHAAEQLKRRGITNNYVSEIGNARYHMERALKNTDWRVGTVDVFNEENLFEKTLTVSKSLRKTPSDMAFGSYAEIRGAIGESIYDSESGWTDAKITVTSIGKNICDGMIEQGGLNMATGVPDYHDSASRYRSITYLYVKPFQGKVLKLSGVNVGGASWHVFDESKARIRHSQGPTHLFINSGDCYIKYELWANASGSANFVGPPTNVQIEIVESIDSSATGYEKYVIPYSLTLTLGKCDTVDRNQIIRKTVYDDETGTVTIANVGKVEALPIYSVKLYKGGYIYAEIDGGNDTNVQMCYTVMEGNGGSPREKYRSVNKNIGTSIFDELRSIADTFSGKLDFDGYNKVVNLKKTIGRDTGIAFKPGYNMSEIKRERSSTDILTRLFVVNQTSEGGYIGIEDVNPIGTNFILDFSYYEELGVLTAAQKNAINEYEALSSYLSDQYREAYDVYTHYSNSVNLLVGHTPMGMATITNVNGNTVTIGRILTYDGGNEPKVGDTIYVRGTNGAWEKREVGSYSHGTRKITLTEAVDNGTTAWWMSRPAAGVVGARIVALDTKREIFENYAEQIQEINDRLAFGNTQTIDDEATEGTENIEQKNTNGLTDEQIADLQKDLAELNTKLAELNNEIAELSNGSATVVGLNQYFAQLVAEIDRFNSISETIENILNQKTSAFEEFEQLMGEMIHDGVMPNGDYAAGQELALFEDACEYLGEHSHPLVEYSVTAVDRSAYGDEYAIERLMYGDIVYVDDPVLNINGITAEITKYTDRPMKNGSNSFTVGNFKEKPIELFEKIVKSADHIAENKKKYDAAAAIFDENGNINAELIINSISNSGALNEIQISTQVINEYLKNAGVNWNGISGLEAVVANIAKATIKEAFIDAAHINQLSANNITTGTLSADRIGAYSIESKHIKTYEITAENAIIEKGVIGATQIADGSITDAKIVELTGDKIKVGTLLADRLAIKGEDGLFHAINLTSSGLTTEVLSDEKYKNFINGTVIVAKSITADQIAAKTITANEILAGSITAAEIDVTDLFAAEATIQQLNAMDITGNKYLKLMVSDVVKNTSSEVGATQLIKNSKEMKDVTETVGEDEVVLVDWGIDENIYMTTDGEGFGVVRLGAPVNG